MKKNKFIVIAIMLTAVLFTGCSKAKPDTVKKEKVKDGNESATESVLLFGKVNAVTGNELEVLLAKDPYADKAPDSDKDTAGGTAATSLEPALEKGAEAPQAPKLQLDYTGDEKNVTIPAGAKITDQTGGEAKLESIKKGSVIMIAMEKDSVKEIGILE